MLVLAAIMVGGWVLVFRYAQTGRDAGEPELKVSAEPEPVEPDRSKEFEGVTDRTPMGLRDNAAYALLLRRAREKTPAELAAISRRDVLLAHLWETPDLYRAVPVHLLGSAQRVLRYPSKLSPAGWLYEAWVVTPDAARVPYVCVFEEAPKGFPIAPNVSERVVFNGYFLKVMKYQATDVARGAPVLVGRIGWVPREPSEEGGTNTTLQWSLYVIGALFVISLARWIYQLRKLFARPAHATATIARLPSDEIEPAELDAWARSMAGRDDSSPMPAQGELEH
jgi:hypothetical protein